MTYLLLGQRNRKLPVALSSSHPFFVDDCEKFGWHKETVREKPETPQKPKQQSFLGRIEPLIVGAKSCPNISTHEQMVLLMMIYIQ